MALRTGFTAPLAWLLLLLQLVLLQGMVKAEAPSPLALVGKLPPSTLPCVIAALPIGNCTVDGTLAQCLCSNMAIKANISACAQMTIPFADQIKLAQVSGELCADFPQESLSSRVKVTAAACAAIVFPIVALRCVARFQVAKGLWWDDWLALAATVLLAGIFALQIASSDLGFGRHYWDVDPAKAQTILQMFYTTQLLYILIQITAKGSLLAIYHRIFTNKTFRKINWGVIVFLVGHGLIFLGIIAVQCRPISAIWDKSIVGTCVNVTATGFAGAVFSIVEDIVILVLPIPMLLQLQLSGQKKAALIFLFSVGSFACVTSMVRLKFMVSFANSLDSTWDNVDVVVWSIIELSCALICASLPALRPLLSMLPGVLRSRRDATGASSGSRGLSISTGRGQNRKSKMLTPTTNESRDRNQYDSKRPLTTSGSERGLENPDPECGGREDDFELKEVMEKRFVV